jgi:hypothetical protein
MLGKLYQNLWHASCWVGTSALPWFLKRLLDVGTFVGIAYLVWDSLYQTTIGLSFVYSDAATGLENPIAIQNKSNIFSIRNISWQCHVQDATYERNNRLINVIVELGGTSLIEPGRSINISCQKKGGFQAVKIADAKLISAHITMNVTYDADFFGLWQYRRRISVPFTWIDTIAQPQWVQWDFIQ